MFLRRLSIQWKITLLAGLCLLTIVVLLVATSLFQAKRSAVQVFQANTELLDQSARLRLQAHAESQALRVQRYFMDAYQYGNGFARLVQALRERGGEDLRAELVKQARQALAGNPDLIGLYLGRAAVGSTYGAAGAFVVLLVWIYYSTQILLFGAELTFVYAQRFGSGVRTADGAPVEPGAATAPDGAPAAAC